MKSVATNHGWRIPRHLKEGSKVRLMMLHPRFWKNREPVIDPKHVQGLKGDFGQAITALRVLALQCLDLERKPGAQFEVRFCDQIPTNYMTVSHLESGICRMRIEIMPSAIQDPGVFRPLVDLDRVGIVANDLYSALYKEYNMAWDRSELYISWSANDGLKVVKEVDDFVIRELELESTWHRRNQDIVWVRSSTSPIAQNAP